MTFALKSDFIRPLNDYSCQRYVGMFPKGFAEDVLFLMNGMKNCGNKELEGLVI